MALLVEKQWLGSISWIMVVQVQLFHNQLQLFKANCLVADCRCARSIGIAKFQFSFEYQFGK